jgi:hypothetical protein
MLNESDTLFRPQPSHADPKANAFDKEHALQAGEKGFVPYWWDDGGSVSLERVLKNQELGDFPAHDDFAAAGKPNPEHRLSGYSLGSSNHLAQDLGVMLQQSWLLLRDSKDAADRKLAADVAEAAKNLLQCRVNHGYNSIPAVVAPAALATGDAKLLARLPDPADERLFTPSNHYYRSFYDFKPGQRSTLPGFADDDEYTYHAGLARAGGALPKPLAFKIVYDAYTGPLGYRAYCDDAPAVPGINVFDLHPYPVVDGKPADYRSDRKGPGKQPRPIGSRMGPQNMVVTGWALQALAAHPGLWEQIAEPPDAKDLRVYLADPDDADDAPAPAASQLDNVVVRLSATRTALRLEGTATGDAATIELFGRPSAGGTGGAVVKVARNGAKPTADVIDAQGAPLVFTPVVAQKGDLLAFDVTIPFSVAKAQRPWMNGVECGRYSLRVGPHERNFTLASPEAQVKRGLERELAGGLRTWEGIFDETGFVPSGIGTRNHFDRFSDTGGYAHLISAAAQYVIHLEGKRDWERQDFPKTSR